MGMIDRKTYSIRMRPELMKALKKAAADETSSLSSLIEQAVEDMLRNMKQNKDPEDKGA
jgi:hypothetical protein